MPDPAADVVRTTAGSYDAGAASWHAAHRGEQRDRTRASGYDRFAELVPPGSLVLDLGCGSGLDMPHLASRGFTVVGLDISMQMLRIVRREGVAAERLVAGDMRHLPFADETLDAVLADGSLHHLPKQQVRVALAEVARVLRRGGIFSASVERGTFEGFVENQEGVPGRRWYSYFEPDELGAMLEEAGLSVIETFVGGRSEHTAGFVAVTAQKQ